MQHPPPDAITDPLKPNSLGSHNEVVSLCETGLSQPAISNADIGPLTKRILLESAKIRVPRKSFKVWVSEDTHKKLSDLCKSPNAEVDVNDFFLKLFTSVSASKASANFTGKKLITDREVELTKQLRDYASKLAEYPEEVAE